MGAPLVCSRCGTVYPEAARGDSESCGVCGGTLQPRTSAVDPPAKTSGWLWLAAFPWDVVLILSLVAGGIALWLTG